MTRLQFDPEVLEQKNIYKLLTAAVIPRPIGWISTLNAAGVKNLAPFSYFNLIADDPPHVMFSTVRNAGANKDTLNNILETGEFVVNMVTEDNVQACNTTSAAVDPEVDEFELANLTPVPAHLVKPFLVKESPIQFECRLVHHYEVQGHKYGGAVMMVGRVVMIHCDASLVNDQYRIDTELYRPVARLAGANYAKLGEIFTLKRP
jgi:flavin reductase (DIM6/NTAB) family NADH-FMN oxidoreductase RutF